MPQTAGSFERFIRLPLSGYNGVDAVGRGARQLENNAVRQADRDLSGTGKPSGSHADLIRTVRRLHHGRFAREHDHVMSVEIDGTVGHVGQLDPLDEFIILPDLGVRYHHIFDPETGYPAASGLRSVTVIDENSTRADALTTALFVMGADKGRAYCEKNGIAAVFITSDRQFFTTEKV